MGSAAGCGGMVQAVAKDKNGTGMWCISSVRTLAPLVPLWRAW